MRSSIGQFQSSIERVFWNVPVLDPDEEDDCVEMVLMLDDVVGPVELIWLEDVVDCDVVDVELDFDAMPA